jgi:indole-3-glycerol phosphate synthase
MNILDKITAFKREEVRSQKMLLPVRQLENSRYFKQQMPSFYDAIASTGPSVIGEFKRRSPSKGIINAEITVEEVVKGYEEAGIAAISVLTDLEFFGGNSQDLTRAASFIKIPLLRKDFIVDEYQVVESKSIGASAILLIAGILGKKEIKELSETATNLGMDVLFEIHDEKELDKIAQGIRIIGINNRNLNTFEVRMDNSINILPHLPPDYIKVAESGFQTPDDVRNLYNQGFNAFLIGEKFMRSDNPGETSFRFMKDLKSVT